MRLPEVGECAAQLPWLWPDAHSLAELAQPLSPRTWPTIRRDPAVLLLLHRHHLTSAQVDDQPLVEPARALEPRVLETALHWLHHDRGSWLDCRHCTILPIYRTALAIAHHARIIAERLQTCDANAAWTAGLLAPLGWLAVAAVDSSAVSDCLFDPHFPDDALETQQRHWGLDHAAIGRRLARRWQLPSWLRIAIGHLDLPIESAIALGADPMLYATVQLAVGMAENANYSLGMIPDLDAELLMDRLKITVGDLRVVQDDFQSVDLAEAFDPDWNDPREIVDLPTELQKAIDLRRSDATPFLAPLERDLDRLHKTLVNWRDGEETRLKTSKLAALAEFAAGASHEINNPLAVISGQSQYLLHQEIEEEFRPALESIVRQTRRIHAILAELMQFARPPQMNCALTPLGDVIRATIDAFQGAANEARVDLDCPASPTPLWVEADPRHLQTAIGCLVRNAIEAVARSPQTGRENAERGWVRIHAASLPDRVEIVVEDSGPGPNPAHRDHLFDPFFSGRTAGRGRGLGLPTAWRLAREHGGDVRYVPTPGGPTRFVLSLPLPAASSRSRERLSA